MLKRPFFIVLIVACIVGCAGHGGGSTLPATRPSPSAQSTTAPLGSSAATVTFATIASGAAGSVGLPATTSGSATATLTLQSTVPTGVATPSAIAVRKTPHTASLGGTVTSLVYVTLSVSANVTIGQTPSFTFTFPSGALAGTGYIAFYDPGHATQGWQQIAGPVAATGTSISFPATSLSPAATLTANATYIFALVTTATTLPAPTPADCPTNYTPVAGGVPLNITDDSGLSGAQLVVYVFNAGTGTFLSTDGTDDSGVPVPFPAACYSTTTGSAGTQQLLVPTGATGGRIYFAYAPYTAGSATIPNPFAGGSSSGPPGVGGGMLVGYPWDFIEYGTAVSGTTDDTSQVDALGLPIQLSIGATPLPALTPGAQPTPPPAGTTPVPCPTAAGSNYVGVSSCNFANIFYAMENSQNISNNVLTGVFPSGGSTIDLRVISPGESAGITAYPWNVFAQASTIVSPTPTFCPSPAPYGYLSCLLATYQQTGRVFTSVVPGAGPVKAGATPGPDFVTGDYYCVTSDGQTNFTFTDIGTTQTTTCPTPDPSASPSAAPSVFHMNVYNLMYGVPPLNDNAQQTTCKPAILLQQPWGLANVDNTVEAAATGNAGGHIFANDDAFAVWKGMIADIVYGTALSTTQVHPVGAVTPPPPSVGLLFKDPMYDHYDYILHQYFDNGLTYGLAYDDLYGLESGVLWNPGDPIDVRINAIPTAASVITPPNPSANPSPCPVLTPGIGTAY